MAEISSNESAALPRAGYRAWQASMLAAGAVFVVAGAAMMATHLISQTADPLQSAEFIAAKEQLRANPKDEKLKGQIRELDLELRSSYFRGLTIKRQGIWFLLTSGALFVLAAAQVARFHSRWPKPPPRPHAASDAARAARFSRWAVTAGGLVIASGFLTLAFGSRSTLQTSGAAFIKRAAGPLETADASPPDAASPEELQRNWPRFRGFEGAGVSLSTNFPLHWSTTNQENILWKIPAPTPGYSSPVVWNNRVFLSGAPGGQGEVLCLDGDTGMILWRQPLKPGAAAPSGKEPPNSSLVAAATVATDGRRIYAIFGSGELGAFTLDGKLVWSKSLGVPNNQYGHAASLATWRDTLIVQMDQGEAKAAKSRLYAFDGRTGEVRWQRPRSVPSSWATPIVVEPAGKPQVITLADPCIVAYSASDGAEIWRADFLSGEILPSPIFAGGLIVVASPADKLLALPSGATGVVARTHLVWTSEANVPDIASPVSDGELLFTITTGGLLTCFDLKTGAQQWEHDFEMECYACPSIAGGRLYLVGLRGDVAIVEPARQFKEIWRARIADEFQASPAFARGRIYLRGVTNVFCIAAENHKLVRQ